MADESTTTETSSTEGGTQTETSTEKGTQTESNDASLALSQGLEEVSEAELMGTDDDTTEETKEKTKEETSTDDKSIEETSKEKESSEETKETKETSTKTDTEKEKSTESDTTASSESSDKIPKGLVKIEALHESRDTNKFLKGRIHELEQQIKSGTVKVEDKETQKVIEVPEFEILSNADFKMLSEDSPAEAMQYMHALEAHNALVTKADEATKQAATEQAEAESNVELTNQIISEATTLMEEAVPGIFDKESTVQAELVEFADSIGFSDDMFYLTNPETKIILPGSTEALLLGDQAASILKTLATAKSKISEAKTSVDEKTIEARIRKEVEAELVAKFKSDKEGTFKSLSEATKTKGETNLGSTSDVLSDTEYNKLSEKEQEAYLSGT